ncbi:MAG: FHA domain-containing protein, partial [Deltaproteobacteria bacterium]|nr:FHA domain-containing protein [Deltaproteobacteria bacterium]
SMGYAQAPAVAGPPTASGGANPYGQPQGQPSPHASQQAAVDTSAGARIVAILKDGSEGRAFVLSGDQTDIGRTEGNIVLSEDPYLSPRHARITRRSGRYYIRDLDTTNGTFVRLRDAVELKHGDVFLMGQQVLLFEVLSEAETPLGPAMQHGVLLFGTPEVARVARIIQRTTEGLGRDVHYLHREETVLGRETGDVVFTDDPFLSRRHASISHDRAARRFLLRDLGSSNGTSVLFRGEQPLVHGDQFRVGHHLFRFELLSSAAGSGGGGAGGGGS